MGKELPTRLASEPIIEVVSEARFDVAGDAAINLLPGIFHQRLGPFDQQGRAFPATLPAEAFMAAPELAYRPQMIMSRGSELIQIGHKSVSVALRAPYPGWAKFKAFICSVFDVLSEQTFIEAFNWLSLKYVDVISFDGESPRLRWLDANITLGDATIDEQPCTLRVEYVADPVTTVLQVSSPVQTQGAGLPVKTGLLVDVDTIHREHFNDFQGKYRAVLENLHDLNKQHFFSLLSDETKERLGPMY